MRQIKNIFHTRVVIQDAPSGTRYDFQPGEVKKVGRAKGQVKTKDVDYLLSKERSSPAGCCNGSASFIKYFEEV